MAFRELKAEHSRAWGAGAYERIPPFYEPMLDHITGRLDPRPGERWLDLGTGTGALAERAAAVGARVVGIDMAPPMVMTARRRAADAGLRVAYEVGDVEDLPHPDESFDVVASNVGAVFSPDHPAVAGELARVCRRGGRLGVTAWRREPAISGLFDVISRFENPSPPGTGSPLGWGRPEHVEELLGDAFELSFEPGDAPLRASSGEEVWDLFSTVHGPTRKLAERLDPDRRAELHRAYVEFHEGFRTEGGICKPGPYLLTLGRRR
jgi:SAM-dependent methyltransferase